MRPFDQADHNVQLMLTDRGNPARSARSAGPRGVRRSPMSDALAALAFTRLFPFVPIARTSLERKRARMA
jgi:hypothetical protein